MLWIVSATLGLTGLDVGEGVESGISEVDEAFVDEEGGGERTDSEDAEEASEMLLTRFTLR
jgi:hypothetical protein